MSNTTKLEIKTALKVRRNRHDAFEAIVDPDQMSHYFISKSTGRIEEGANLIWQFPEFDMEFPVRVDEVRPDEFISWYWKDPEGNETKVEVTLRTMDDASTFVTVIEKSRDNNEKGIQWLKSNTEGWANFLASLKAWLEYGINLREGAFDISQMPAGETKDVTV